MITNQVVKRLLKLEAKSTPTTAYDFDVLEVQEVVFASGGSVRRLLQVLLSSIEASLKANLPKNVEKKVQNGLMTWSQIKDLTEMLPETHVVPYVKTVPAFHVAIMVNSNDLRSLGNVFDLVMRQKEADLLGPMSPKKKRKTEKAKTTSGSNSVAPFQYNSLVGKLLILSFHPQ